MQRHRAMFLTAKATVLVANSPEKRITDRMQAIMQEMLPRQVRPHAACAGLDWLTARLERL